MPGALEIPIVWSNFHEESARYKLELSLSEEVVQTCYYYNNYTVIRKRWNAEVVLTDLETGIIIGTAVFPGEDPGSVIALKASTRGLARKM